MKQPARKPSWRIMALNEVALTFDDLRQALWRNIWKLADWWFRR